MDQDKLISPKRHRRVTAQDVADAAGVSRSAVSRAFTEGTYLDEEKRQRVRAAALDLGYRPNALAAGLQGGRSHLVAIFVGDMRNAYDTEVVTRLVGALNAIQKWPILIDGGGLSSVKEAMGEVLRYPLDALILRSGSMDPAIARECTKLHIPVISSGRVLNHPQIDNVCCRNQEGSHAAAQLLLDRGRVRFGYIAGPAGYSSSSARQDGMIRALAAAGLTPVAVEQGDFTVEGGLAAAERLFERARLDALLCANDAMAIGALGAARARGIDVPNDLSIVGFDDISMARWPGINLTTVCNPIDIYADKVVELLAARLADPEKPSDVAYIDTHLVLRGTH